MNNFIISLTLVTDYIVRERKIKNAGFGATTGVLQSSGVNLEQYFKPLGLLSIAEHNKSWSHCWLRITLL